MLADVAFTLDDVVVERGGTRVLDGITDHIHRAATTAVVGPSGSGKSTLLRLLNRFEEPTSGVIRLDERALPALDVHVLRRRVGLVAQHATMLEATVREEVRVARPILSDAQVTELLVRVALPEIELNDATATLSGGEAQRLALARSLAVEPEVLLLDEPTSALDDRSATAVDEVIRGLVADGLTVVLVSHDLERVAGLADSVMVLDHGRLVERGAPNEIGYLS